MQDRVKLNNGRSSKLLCPSDYSPTDFATFLADLKAGNVYVDITANNSDGSDAGVSVIGTAINKANTLTDSTAEGFGFAVSDNPTVNDVLKRIGADYIRGTLVAGSTSLTLTDARIKTTSHIDIYPSSYSAFPVTVTVNNGSMTMRFDAQSSNVTIDVRVY